ncbi:MucR family transcriptional regulator [Sphingomonas sp. H39-1-10]|uniref:MucR family transcriptional regulator n=1 Tax=Sphingomonas TaxID=13687 RepID=UPI00088B4A32|nr:MULTISPECIES: MucR family transcriptional regulator [Sphingomonas]MDF0489571.1 MucR family transcriptional regulator [Sphingomonas pollutisoli]SDA28502.1 transcriptional regulator, MucR family [Sphingomonas sp. NFR15]
MAEETLNPIELATELTIAWLGNQNNRVSAEDVPAFLRTMHGTLLELDSGSSATETTGEETPAADAFTPAVSVRKSLASKDYIISMIDGKPYKTLRRHLSTHGLTDVQYRERYNLRPDYPMVSENYSLARRAMAQRIGLGRKGRGAAHAPEEASATGEPDAASAKRTRRKADETA